MEHTCASRIRPCYSHCWIPITKAIEEKGYIDIYITDKRCFDAMVRELAVCKRGKISQDQKKITFSSHKDETPCAQIFARIVAVMIFCLAYNREQTYKKKRKQFYFYLSRKLHIAEEFFEIKH